MGIIWNFNKEGGFKLHCIECSETYILEGRKVELRIDCKEGYYWRYRGNSLIYSRKSL